MIRLALVGPGRWGRILVEAVQGVSREVTFTHAVARSPEKARAWCEARGIALVGTLADALDMGQLEGGIDGVVLATPHSRHAAQIEEAASASMPVFCEKPVALNVADAGRALDAVRATGTVFAAGHNRRFLPAVLQMKRMIDAGELGRLLHAEGNMSSHVGFGEVYTPDLWRVAAGESPAGGLAAAGIHVIDLMIHLLGPVASVVAQSDRLVHEIDHDDTTGMLLRFASRASGYVGTMTATGREFRLQVFGERGWLELRGETELTWTPVEGVTRTWRHPAVSTERLELEAFAAAIRRAAPYPVHEDDLLNGIAVFEGVSASLASDGRVDVSRRTIPESNL